MAAAPAEQPTAVAAPAMAAREPVDLVARGDYLVRTTGCNDCHTAGYAEQQGQVDRAQWLTGSPLGYTGPWGTTYAPNLRLTLAEMDEAQWLHYSAHLRTRPIMPDFALREMSEDDRRAMFHFIKSLGPGGAPAPAYLPPGQKPQPPYMALVLPAQPIAAVTPDQN
ncbi:MAG: c-type cytochrome [Proteobacteria bacterium]|nr:c-type cytochrome [Pseudomonadota bacterium]